MVKKKLDATDLKILMAIQEIGPRNLTKVASKVGMHRSSLAFRLKTLMSPLFHLRFTANIYHVNLGLKKAVIFVKATSGYEDFLFDCLKANGFWIYLSRFYGLGEGCLGIYTIPKGHEHQFENFVAELKRLKIAEHIEINWSTCFQHAYLTDELYDAKSQTWSFDWDKWSRSLESEKTDLPYTLKDPKDFPILADQTDVYILKELEKNAAIDLSELSKKLGISVQAVEYRYKKLLRANLIEGYETFIFPFGADNTALYFFKFDFSSQMNMAKFAMSLMRKPFASVLGKILGKTSIVAGVRLPPTEFRKFIDTISELTRKGFIKNFEYVIQDLRKIARQTFSYEYFKDSSWTYDHARHLKDLHQLVRKHKITAPIRKQI